MKMINSLISIIVLIVMLVSPQGNVSAADILTWENRQDMPTPRYSMGAAVSGGKIYAVGGDNYSCTPLNNVEEYDPDTDTWNIRKSMPTGRWALGTATAPDGKIYAIGGAGGNCGADILGTVEMYDPVTDTWESRTSMPTPRMELRVVAAANGKIYAMGGKDNNSNWFATVEEYDPATDTWTTKSNMPWANKLFAITASSDGRIYVLGGDANPQALLVYDPATDSWESRASMPTARYNLAMSQASNGRMYAVGGDWGGATTTVESYNPEYDSWSAETSISTPRTGHSVVTVGGTLYVLGGWGGSEPIGSVEAGTITIFPPPANDNFAAAMVINSLPFSDIQNTAGATIEYGEPQNCVYSSHTVWYSFTPTANVSVLASMTGSNFNTNISVYQKTAEGLGGLRFTGCATGGFDFIAHKGVTYYLQVGANDIGDLHLDIREGSPLPPPPANDDFENAVLFSSLPFNDLVDVSFASRELGEPQSCDFSSQTVWYKFTPTANAEVSINTEGSSFSDTVLSVYEQIGSGFSGLNHLSCVSWGGSLTFSAQEGATYYIQAGSINSFSGELHINLQEVFPPANDDFANATSMSPLPFSDTVDTTWATVEPDESHYCDYSPRTVWYKFTPSANTELRVTTEGSPFSDIVLTAYRDTGSGLAGLNAFTCVSYVGSLTFAVEEGVAYYIQAGYISNSGELHVNLQEVPPPANDNFADATVIPSPLPFDETVDAAGATAEAGEPLSSCAGYGGPYKSIWYAYTPTKSGVISANVPSAVFAPVLTVYSGNAMDSLTELGCQVYSGNPVSFPVEAGTTYYFQVSKYTTWDPDGSVQFQLRELNPPSNDNFTDAMVIKALTFSNTMDITDATTEPDEPQYCNYSPKTVWYSFTTDTNTLVQVDMFGSSFWDTTFTIYQAYGSGITDLSFLQCASFGGSATFMAQAGMTYYIQAGSVYGNGGSLQLNLQEIIRPANDDFANAEIVEALTFSGSVDISNATIEPGEPQGCYYSPKTVWYSFTPSENMLVKADMLGSSFWDTVLNIYQATDSNMSNLIFQQCANFGEAAMFTAQAGVTYYFQAGSYYGSGGMLQLNVQELPRPANDDFANARLISALPFEETPNTQYATREAGEPMPSCRYSGAGERSVWYAYTPTETGSLSANIPWATVSPVLAVYTGNPLSNLTEIGCRSNGSSLLTFKANAGTTYYFQISNFYPWESGGEIDFRLQITPPPVAEFSYYHPEPSTFDTIEFYNLSYDPGNMGFDSFTWDFGDGTTSVASNPTHRYAKDGDYTVKLSVTTFDGRTATTSQVIQVRTRDVAITKLSAPQSASAGQTRTITVSISSKTYAETVQVDLYRSGPGGFEFIGTRTLTVPAYNANRTVAYNFSYTFTSSDASIGKVTFYAVATIVDGRDIYPADNEAYSLPTKINKRR